MRGDVIAESELLLSTEDLVVEDTSLSEVVFISRVPPGHVSGEVSPVLLVLPVRPRAAEGVREVVRSSSLVVCHCHGTISLVVPGPGSEGTVHWYLVLEGWRLREGNFMIAFALFIMYNV